MGRRIGYSGRTFVCYRPFVNFLIGSGFRVRVQREREREVSGAR